MRRLFLALVLSLFPLAAHAAESAIVVSSCGTPPTTYTAGQSFAQTMDTTGKLCTGASVTPGGTQDVNLKTVNGATTNAFGSGVVGTSTLRVTQATDVPVNAAQSGNWTSRIVGNAGAALDAATGAAPPANAVQVGAVGSGATGGFLLGLKTCDQHAKYDASDNGSTTLVTGVSGRKVYICGYILAVTTGTIPNLKLVEGSDANCSSNAADLTPAYVLAANGSIGFMSPFWTGLNNSTTGYYVCVNASAGQAHKAEIWYTIQ